MDRIGGRVMLAVRNNILSICRKDLENEQTELFELYEGFQESTETSLQI